jgi:hypothetical protein
MVDVKKNKKNSAIARHGAGRPPYWCIISCSFFMRVADSAAAPALGVYDGNGVLLVPLSALKTVTATLFGQEYTFDVDRDGSAVALTRCATTSDKDAQCKAFVQDRAYKIRMREEDSKTVQQVITAKQLEIEDSYNEERDASYRKDRMEELEWLLLQRGKHKKEISALQQEADQKITVTNTSCFEATKLPLGQAFVLAPHGKVCMFLHRPPENTVSWGWKDTAVESIVYPALEIQKMALCSKNLPYTTFVANKNGVHSVVTTAQFVFLSFPEHSYVAQYSLSGELVKRIGNKGLVDRNKLVRPMGMAVLNGLLFVADHAKDHVCVYTIKTGTKAQHLGTTDTMEQPTDVATDGERVFVAAGRTGVHSYFYDYPLREYIKDPSTSWQYHRLEAEAVAVYGNVVYVTYTGKNTVGTFDSRDGRALNEIDLHVVDSFEPIRWRDCFPGILVGARYVFVVRGTQGVVYVFNRATRAFVTFLTTDKMDSHTAVPRSLVGLAFDTQGCLLVTDAQANCVHKFDLNVILQRYEPN